MIRVWTQPWPKWPYSAPLVAVPLVEGVELAEVGAEPLGRDRGVLPPLPRVGLPGTRARRAETGLADLPDVALLVAVRRMSFTVGLRAPRRRPAIAFLAFATASSRSRPAELDEQPALAVGEQVQALLGAAASSSCPRRAARRIPSRPIGRCRRTSGTWSAAA